MADHFYGVNLGAKSPDDLTFGTSTGSTAVELRVTDATTGITKDKKVLLNLVRIIQDYIAQADAPA